MEWSIKGKDIIGWGIALTTGLVVPILIFRWGKKTTENLEKKILDEVEERKKLEKKMERERLRNSTKEAIERILKKAEEDWKYYLDNPKKGLPSFQLPETRRKHKQILTWIIEARKNGNYEELVKKWNRGKDYNAEEDFDGSLNVLMEYLKILKGEKTENLFFPYL